MVCINKGDEERGGILDLYQNHGIIILIRRVKRKSVRPFCVFQYSQCSWKQNISSREGARNHCRPPVCNERQNVCDNTHGNDMSKEVELMQNHGIVNLKAFGPLYLTWTEQSVTIVALKLKAKRFSRKESQGSESRAGKTKGTFP